MPGSMEEHLASLTAHDVPDDRDIQWGHCAICGTWFIQDMGCPYCHGNPDNVRR